MLKRIGKVEQPHPSVRLECLVGRTGFEPALARFRSEVLALEDLPRERGLFSGATRLVLPVSKGRIFLRPGCDGWETESQTRATRFQSEDAVVTPFPIKHAFTVCLQTLIQFRNCGRRHVYRSRDWGDRRDLNPDWEGHNLPCFHYTTATRRPTLSDNGAHSVEWRIRSRKGATNSYDPCPVLGGASVVLASSLRQWCVDLLLTVVGGSPEIRTQNDWV